MPKISPWMILAGLTHGYHWKLNEFGPGPIMDTYNHAMATGKYESVLIVGGGRKKAWAATNQMEYFASMSVA